MRLTKLFDNFFNSEKAGGLILIICTVISLVVANSFFGDAYVHFMHKKIDLSFFNINLNYSIEHWVNDGLMAIFFLMIGLEVKRELLIGELSSFKKALLPIAAALGGMLMPALIHFILNKGTATQPGFAIPMATDIAFALGVLALAGKRVPAAVKIFLAALAIADDIGAIVIIAFFYTQTIFFSYLLIGLGIFILLFVLNRLKVNSLFFYLVPGVVMWYCFLQSGVHATIAGVLLAFTIPSRQDGAKNLSYQLQHSLHIPVAFLIVPIFALVNTAIVLPQNIIASLSTSNSAGIIGGLLIGKLAGIFIFPWVLIRSGYGSFTEGLNWRYLIGIGLLGGIGFTMSMFISNLAFTDATVIIASKLSILVGSSLCAISGLLIFIFAKPFAENVKEHK